MKIEYSKYNAFNIFKPVIKNPGYPSLNMNLDLGMILRRILFDSNLNK